MTLFLQLWHNKKLQQICYNLQHYTSQRPSRFSAFEITNNEVQHYRNLQLIWNEASLIMSKSATCSPPMFSFFILEQRAPTNPLTSYLSAAYQILWRSTFWPDLSDTTLHIQCKHFYQDQIVWGRSPHFSRQNLCLLSPRPCWP